MESRSFSQKYQVKYRACKIISKKIKTQSNHIFMSLLATEKLEGLSVKKGLTTFGLKTKLYIKAQKEALRAWQLMQASTA
jgi:hypothetical protein